MLTRLPSNLDSGLCYPRRRNQNLFLAIVLTGDTPLINFLTFMFFKLNKCSPIFNRKLYELRTSMIPECCSSGFGRECSIQCANSSIPSFLSFLDLLYLSFPSLAPLLMPKQRNLANMKGRASQEILVCSKEDSFLVLFVGLSFGSV